MSEILSEDEVERCRNVTGVEAVWSGEIVGKIAPGDLERLCYSHEELREWAVEIAENVVKKYGIEHEGGEWEGWYEAGPNLHVMMSGELLAEVKEWQRHAEQRENEEFARWFYKPPEKDDD